MFELFIDMRKISDLSSFFKIIVRQYTWKLKHGYSIVDVKEN